MPEFIEATARVADKLSLPPIIDEEQYNESPEEASNIQESVKKRIKKSYPNLKLHYKIETLIYLMARSCLKKNDIEIMEKITIKYYDELKNAPKARKYDISNRQY